MRRRSHRHPALEAAVFAAALLLAAFIGRELWQRRGAAAIAPAPLAPQPVEPAPTFVPVPVAVGASRTETAVTGVAPIRLSRVQRRRPKPPVVPVPK